MLKFRHALSNILLRNIYTSSHVSFQSQLSENQESNYDKDQHGYSDLDDKQGQTLDMKDFEVQDQSLQSSSVVLFPGQGSQFIGMGKKLLNFPGVRQIYEHASETIKFDLLHLCLYGSKEDLNKTFNCQVAVFVTAVAAIEKMKMENPSVLERIAATAGFGVGEFAAMVLAEMLTFEDALHIVNVRARSMQNVSKETNGGMMTVFTFHGSELALAIKAAIQHCEINMGMQHPVCKVAYHLFGEAKVLAGHEEALEFIAKNHKDFGIRGCKRLAASGAFHTELMTNVRVPVRKALSGVDIKMPKFQLYSNVTGTSVTDLNKFKMDIVNQIVKPIKWEQIMSGLYPQKKGTVHYNTYECGPGSQLGLFLEKISKGTKNYYSQIEV